MTLGQRLTYYREQKRLAREQLALLLGVNEQTLEGWETDLFEPNVASLVKLSYIFDVSLDTMLTGRERTAAAQPTATKPATAPKQKKKFPRPKPIHIVLMSVVLVLAVLLSIFIPILARPASILGTTRVKVGWTEETVIAKLGTPHRKTVVIANTVMDYDDIESKIDFYEWLYDTKLEYSDITFYYYNGQYGKIAAKKAIIGKVMAATGGKANPIVLNEIFESVTSN